MNIETPLSTMRVPQQGRSRASFERMLVAAEELMAERGTDDFTLNEIGKRGKVSIGSIYCRFDSKDDLVRAVQARVLERVNDKQLRKVADARASERDLESLVERLVEDVAETLREFSAVMRPLMLRATTDPIVSTVGKQRYAEVAEAVKAALLDHRTEIKQPDPTRAVNSAFRILYATIARYLGFGSATEAAWKGDWRVLKEDLGRMIAAFLMHAPHERHSA